MTVNFWGFLGIMAIGALIALFINGFVTYIKSESTCTICGKQRSVENPLIRCPTCKKWFCADNLERIEEAHTSLQKIVDIVPTKKNLGYPCGTAYIKMGKTESILCKKDSKRLLYTIKLRLDK